MRTTSALLAIGFGALVLVAIVVDTLQLRSLSPVALPWLPIVVLIFALSLLALHGGKSDGLPPLWSFLIGMSLPKLALRFLPVYRGVFDWIGVLFLSLGLSLALAACVKEWRQEPIHEAPGAAELLTSVGVLSFVAIGFISCWYIHQLDLAGRAAAAAPYILIDDVLTWVSQAAGLECGILILGSVAALILIRKSMTLIISLLAFALGLISFDFKTTLWFLTNGIASASQDDLANFVFTSSATALCLLGLMYC
jgi:hypothetical protein